MKKALGITLAASVMSFTLLAQHGVRSRERAAAIDLLAAGALGSEPSNCDHRNQNRQPEPPTAQGMGLLEVLQVHSLGEILGCAYAPRHNSFQYRNAITACTAPSSNKA